MSLEDLDDSDIETLRKLLELSHRADPERRKALCIEIDIKPAELSAIWTLTTHDFVIELIDLLQKRKLEIAIYKLSLQLQSSFEGSKDAPQLNAIIRKIKYENGVNDIPRYSQNQNEIKQIQERLLTLDSESNDEIEIPFVIVAMTLDEAKYLQETAFNKFEAINKEFEEFQNLTQMIQQHGILDFVSHYDEIREDWKPYVCQNFTIKSIINNIVEDINIYRKEITNLPLIRPKFLSQDCLGLDDDKRVTTWNDLRQLGCILIVDSISLFHPKVKEKLLKAEISSNKNTAILVISPINPSNIQANKLLEERIKSHMEPAFLRFEEELDKLCEIGIGDLRAINRWFFSVLPETAEIIIKHKPQLKNKLKFRKKMGPKNGVDKLWTGNNR
ncbi:hypothetical protein G7B40_041030 [Aetokthonos hydrillicola Thurmond2011]|jgi:hypothetical protein|uniref:Uncharacterized protein n=1 Tax=Aetokthonos hydrillicola Thurmond2011 TaxID=2712845 RepID=A0AAP5IFX2_9CYAN|nr:hypothetical protein [Aetokthonos hydrillicola]MBO3463027.1 hypothetical protein [Aetokthonos hydrillicola CCALA 1050]MBW4590844.1 hypothetical protein [Aetokthonos hydrillicola CCALA 1050]MDR9900871.1 hypothetical protein [Aetokthonos hydrillicola Thurmond2011]